MNGLTPVIFVLSLIVGGYFGYKSGKWSGISKVLDTITEDYHKNQGSFLSLENNICGHEILFQGTMDFYSAHQDRMNDDERNKEFKRIKEESEKIDRLKEELRMKIEENPVEYREEILVNEAKNEMLLKFIKTARYPYTLISDEEEKEYINKIK